MAESRGGREPPSAWPVKLDTEKRPWLGGVRANQVATAKGEGALKLGRAPGDQTWSVQDAALQASSGFPKT